MSAVPKKKLCWNCEGSVSKEIDNCPYCSVYLHGDEKEGGQEAGFSFYSSKTEDIPSPPYQVQSDQEEVNPPSDEEKFSEPMVWKQLKRDVLPALLLMAGSVFFLFGIILLLFSQDGVLILQWQEHYWIYFLSFSFPSLYFGWRFLQQLAD